MSKHKDHKALVGRVKKAVKKTRRKLSEDQFNKELQRTINFLSELKDHVNHLQAQEKVKPKDKAKVTPPSNPKAPKAQKASTGIDKAKTEAKPATTAKPAAKLKK